MHGPTQTSTNVHDSDCHGRTRRSYDLGWPSVVVFCLLPSCQSIHILPPHTFRSFLKTFSTVDSTMSPIHFQFYLFSYLSGKLRLLSCSYSPLSLFEGIPLAFFKSPRRNKSPHLLTPLEVEVLIRPRSTRTHGEFLEPLPGFSLSSVNLSKFVPH